MNHSKVCHRAAEFARLEEQANGVNELLSHKIVHAPLHRPQKILEVGCGTGHVCRQLAQQFPDATVLGVDLTPVPPCSNTPQNISYITGDIKQVAQSDERLMNGDLDYIFGRFLIAGMTSWPGYIRQMATLLRPGGYFEMHEVSYRLYKCSSATPRVPSDEDPAIGADWPWQRALLRGEEQLGLDTDIGPNVQRYMKDAGLVDIEVKKYVMPFGTWMVDEKPETRRLGAELGESCREVMGEYVLPGVTRGLGIGEEDMRRLKEECKHCFESEEGKYWWFYVTVGRKV